MASFSLIRAHAIETYANVEQSLFMIFANWLGAPNDRAGIVFFRITSSHARNKILEGLLKKAHGSQFDVYWYGAPHNNNGLFTLIRQLNARRNEIVHWHVAMEISSGEGDQATTRETLTPPDFWNRSENTPSLIAEQLVEFCTKADFVYRSLNMFFAMTAIKELSDEQRQPWLDIFPQPVVYPPPDTHPLSPKQTIPGIPPPTFRA